MHIKSFDFVKESKHGILCVKHMIFFILSYKHNLRKALKDYVLTIASNIPMIVFQILIVSMELFVTLHVLTPQHQNGIAKTKSRHLFEVARAILFQISVSKSYWVKQYSLMPI